MKVLTFSLLFCLITACLQGQCDSISKDILNIIVKEKYEKFNSLLMPIEQKRKVLHWPKTEESNKMLLSIKDSLKKGLIISAKELRLELLDKEFDLSEIKFDRCQFDSGRLDIFISNKQKKYNFMVETLKTDKIYLALPINEIAHGRSSFQGTKEEKANFIIVIDGEKFKSFEPSEKDKEKGLGILKKCTNIVSETNSKILKIQGMKDKNDISILVFTSLEKSGIKTYNVVLEKEICEKK